MENGFLVSVIVATYNSSNTVLETLNSVSSQTYQNLELIISDDCSKDDTVSICRFWIKENSKRFKRIVLLESSSNKGVSGNMLSAKKAVKSEWVKSIAGDDILLPNCIADFVEYVKENPATVVVFGRVNVFGTSIERINFFNKFFDYSFFDLNAQEQYIRLLEHGNCIPAPSAFENVNRIKEIGVTYDERIPLLEDLPYWINITGKGVKLVFLNKEVVKYRVGNGGLSSGGFNYNFFISNRLFYFYYVYPYLFDKDPEKVVKEQIDYEISLHKKAKSAFSTVDYKLGHTILSPIRWIKNLLK